MPQLDVHPPSDAVLRVDAVNPLGRLAVAGQRVVGEGIGADPRPVDQQFAVHVGQRAGGMMMAHAEIAAALCAGRGPQGDQALLAADHAVPGNAQVAAHVVTVASR